MKWYEIQGNGHDVVISSRVRLARNLEDFPFAPKLDAATSETIAQKTVEALRVGLGEELVVYDMHAPETRKRLLLEDHLVSPDFCTETPLKRLLVTDKSGSLAVMINEEDHVRIQAIVPGFDLEKAYETASRADDVLAESVTLAFDETLGYLTACPTNLGTGLRASVMLHLPALSAYGYIKSLAALMTKIGLTVRGMYGEGSEALGCLYQLSNQVTLGISEKDAIEKLTGAVKQIVAKERELRTQMLADKNGDTADKLWRSFGTLRYARKLDTAEAARLLSNVRFGAVCGVIPEAQNINLIGLLFSVMPAHILQKYPDAKTPEKRGECRADYVRRVFSA